MTTLRYRGASFLLCDGRVYAFQVTANEARTLRGVTVGNDLDSVQSLYRSFDCDEVQTGDRGSQPLCTGTVSAGRHVWFGEDPIGSITVSTTAF